MRLGGITQALLCKFLAALLILVTGTLLKKVGIERDERLHNVLRINDRRVAIMIIMDKLAVFAIRKRHESIIKFWDCPVVEPIADTDSESLYLILLNDVECTEIMEDFNKPPFNPGNKSAEIILIATDSCNRFRLPARYSITE